MASDRLAPSRTFTPREVEIINRLARGRTVPTIASELHCSVHTVKTHIRAIARAIPGSLPAQMRIRSWYAGGRLEDLTV